MVKQNIFYVAFWVHLYINFLDDVFLNIYLTTYFYEFIYFYLTIKFVKLFIYPRIRERLLERFTDNFVIGICSAAIYQVQLNIFISIFYFPTLKWHFFPCWQYRVSENIIATIKIRNNYGTRAQSDLDCLKYNFIESNVQIQISLLANKLEIIMVPSNH